MSRPRRAAASSSHTPQTDRVDTMEDPDYLALSGKQRRAIDRAFTRGLKAGRPRGESARKRRKVEEGRAVHVPPSDGGGGFVEAEGGGGFIPDDDEGGGFVLDDEEGGGFIPDEGEGGFIVDDEGGGFMPDSNDNDNQSGAGGFLPTPAAASASASASKTNPSTRASPLSPSDKIPLYILPGLLASLGLPSDEDVLGVFRASASGWDDDDGAQQDEGGVELKDFRAVCAALMSPDDGDGDGEDVDMSDEEGDTFELDSDAESGSDLSSLSGSEYGAEGGTSTTRSKTKNKNAKVTATDYASTPSGSRSTSKRPRKKGLPKDDSGRIKLSSRQRELARDIWLMLKPPSTTDGGEGNAKGKGRDLMLGRDELKKWVRTLGEMWSDDEITEMVTLFSSQNEGRGLSFDDFGGVMLRAGLV